MKKIYTLSVALFLSFLSFNAVLGQYTAAKTGNWSNNVTWAPGVKPSAICNNCTITINSGVTVTLDAAVTLSGTSQLILNSNAKLIIPSSGNNALSPHNSITLSYASPGPTIKLLSSTSVIDASAAGRYDGILNSFAGGLVSTKLVGNAPSIFVLGFASPGANPAPALGQSLTGPVTLSSNGTLPIILVDFTAVLNNGAVNISWTSGVEVNTDHFNIQRSADGTTWKTIGTVAASGNTNAAVSYAYTDNSPLSLVNYYRLQTVDKDAKYAYSDIQVVRGSLIKGFSVFPNPAKEFVNVTLSSLATADLTIRLINLSGQVLQEKKVSNGAGTTVSMAVNTYPEGAYLLQIKGNDGTEQTTKLLITRQ